MKVDNQCSKAACIVISFVMSDKSTFGGEPPKSYSCYFALPKKGILMSPKNLATHEVFAFNEMIPSTEDVSGLENTYERRKAIAPAIRP